MKHLHLLFLILFSTQVMGASYTLDNIQNPKLLNSHSYVTNPDGIIQESTVQQINSMLDSLEMATRTEVAVVLVGSIGNESIEPFATELFKKWGVGKAKEDNGLLILFVLDQKKVRFEVGYGVEGLLTDAMSSRIIRQNMSPYFKLNDYDQGFLSGITQVVRVLKEENFVEEEKSIPWDQVLPIAAAIYIAFLAISFIWLSLSIKKIRNNVELKTNMSKFKALKSEKAGILLVLNILIPAISIFFIIYFTNPVYLILIIGIPLATLPANLYTRFIMWKIRRLPIPCNECKGTMYLLSEKKEDAHLKLSQQFEEQLHAVDYDVFVCKDCGNEAIFTLDKPSIYSECPKCKTKAFILHEKKVIVAPSFVSGGTERTTYKCNFCGYEENNNTHLPRISRSAGSFAAGAAAGSLFSGRGGFGGGGGGFGGGGSFGGGMSGGGGATGGW